MLESLDFLHEMVGYMDSLGWDVHSFDHEDGNGQYEFDFSYTHAVGMADRFMLFRMMAKEVARSHGYEATFMAKPWSDRTGGGAHFNMSLAAVDDGANLFAVGDGEDRYGCGISELGYRFLAGLLAHAPAIVAVTCPTVNSYKRLIRRGAMSGSTWAPVFISYGRNNRTHMLRVPTKSPRVESRAVDASVNAYLGAALVLAAGLSGIERELDPGRRSTSTCTCRRRADRRAGCRVASANAGGGDRRFRGRPARRWRSSGRICTGVHRLQARRVGGLPQHRQPVGVGALPDLLLRPERRSSTDPTGASRTLAHRERSRQAQAAGGSRGREGRPASGALLAMRQPLSEVLPGGTRRRAWASAPPRPVSTRRRARPRGDSEINHPR